MKDQEYRDMPNCPACGKEKPHGNITCWDCFKYRKNNLKESGLSVDKWLETI